MLACGRRFGNLPSFTQKLNQFKFFTGMALLCVAFFFLKCIVNTNT